MLLVFGFTLLLISGVVLGLTLLLVSSLVLCLTLLVIDSVTLLIVLSFVLQRKKILRSNPFIVTSVR